MLKTTHLYLFYSCKAIIKCNNYPSLCLGIKNRFDGSMEKPSVLVQIKMAANPSSLFFFPSSEMSPFKSCYKKEKHSCDVCRALFAHPYPPKKKIIKMFNSLVFFQQISI